MLRSLGSQEHKAITIVYPGKDAILGKGVVTDGLIDTNDV